MSRKSLCLAALALLSFGRHVYAQTGTITGTVRDSVGGVVPGVTITLINTGTNAQRAVETDERGDYNVVLLPAGTYEIRAELPGFKTAVAKDVRVSVDDRLRLNLTLAVGDIAERILVAAAIPLVQSESSSVGNLIDNQKVVELPLNGRQFESLSQLVPGTVSAAPGSPLRSRGGFSAAGARETANNNTLDGIDNNDPATNSFTLRPIVDAIDEFKVLVSSYSAEFGHSGGAQVTVGTRSGTNQFHGAAWEFLRNDKLDARDFFNTRDSGPKPPFHRNQFGGTIGGPVIRDSTFFFFAYEGIRRRQEFASLQQVPTEALRRGDFSAVTSPIRDPENPLTPPFPGNVIPAGRIHPIARRILDRGSFPSPTPGLAVPNNFRAMNPYPDDIHQYNVRVDRRITRANTLFGRYGFTRDALLTPCYGQGQSSCVPGFAHDDITRAQSLSLGDTLLLSPRLILEFRAGFNRQRQSRIALTSGTSDISSEIGIPASRDPRDFGHPQIAITGFSPIGDRGYQNRAGTTVQMAGSVIYTAGSHTARTAVELRRIMYYAGSNARETLRFSGIWSGNAFADFLLGLPSQTTRDPSNSFRYHVLDSYDWFVQDDFAVSSKLTLNLGLRYEYNTPAIEKQDRLAQLNVVTFQYELAGKNGASRALYNPDKNNFGPRLGFAFRPDGTGKTVVRGGYGIFHDPASVGNNLSSVRTGPPFRQPETFDAGTSPNALTLSNPFPSARLNASPIFDAPSIDPNFRDAYIQQWNFGFERQLPGNTVFEVSYVGNKGTRLIRTVDINQAFPVPGVSQPPVQPRRPLPQYGEVSVLQGSANSIYHGLLGRLQRRFSSGLSFLASYTYSHAIDDSGGGNVAQDARNLKADRGSSDFDARQRLVVSYVYELPFGREKRFGKNWSSTLDTILGGWEFSGITAVESGRPIFVQLSPSNQNSNTGSTRDRPNVGLYIDNHYIETGVAPVIRNSRDKTVYLDPRAFSIPPRGTFGNAPRNYFDGPGANNWDLMVGKNFRYERFSVQFRAEFYNAFNHASLNQPNRNPDSSSFGTITSTLQENRQIQLGLKLTY
jgi:carboxypeptidase family protein